MKYKSTEEVFKMVDDYGAIFSFPHGIKEAYGLDREKPFTKYNGRHDNTTIKKLIRQIRNQDIEAIRDMLDGAKIKSIKIDGVTDGEGLKEFTNEVISDIQSKLENLIQ